MPLPRFAAFCVAIALFCAPASAEHIRVYVDVQQAISKAGMSAPTADMLAPIETEAAAIKTEREAHDAAMESFTREALFMIGAQRTNRERQLSTQAEALEQREQALMLARQDLNETTRIQAKTALQDALETYLGLNQVDTIKPFNSTNSVADFVILDPTYDITPTIAGLMRGGDSSIVPPAPKAEAEMVYVNLDLAFEMVGGNEDLEAERQAYLEPVNTQIEALEAQLADLTVQLSSPVLSPNGRAALVKVHGETSAQLSALRTRSAEDVAEIEASKRRNLKLALSEFITTSDSAGEADIVRLYRPGFDTNSAIFVANPALDITADTVANMLDMADADE